MRVQLWSTHASPLLWLQACNGALSRSLRDAQAIVSKFAMCLKCVLEMERRKK
jgi:hypothetical protein